MTHFSDGLRSGAANTPGTSNPLLSVALPGVANANMTRYSIVPLAISAGNIAVSAIVNGAATLAAGTGVTVDTTTFPGQTVLKFDVARCISITGTAGGVTAVPFGFVGYDDYKQPMTQTLTGPAATATVTTLKAFRYLVSATSTGTTTAAVTIQTSDTIGLPHVVTAWDDVVALTANAAKVTASTGFVAAVATNPNTAALGDVRGTYALQTASDGTKRYTFFLHVVNPDTREGTYGVTPA